MNLLTVLSLSEEVLLCLQQAAKVLENCVNTTNAYTQIPESAKMNSLFSAVVLVLLERIAV